MSKDTLRKLFREDSDPIARGIAAADSLADARLRDAARDLLAACQMVVQRWTFNADQKHTHTWHDMQDCMTVLHSAIAKAEGRE